MMTMTQQPDPFSELRGLMATGTPGPWREDGRTIVTDAEVIGNIVTDGPDWANSESDAYWHHNRRLIVAMHQALPALLDERDRLIGENERLKALLSLVDMTAARFGSALNEYIVPGDLVEEIRQALSQEIG